MQGFDEKKICSGGKNGMFVLFQRRSNMRLAPPSPIPPLLKSHLTPFSLKEAPPLRPPHHLYPPPTPVLFFKARRGQNLNREMCFLHSSLLELPWTSVSTESPKGAKISIVFDFIFPNKMSLLHHFLTHWIKRRSPLLWYRYLFLPGRGKNERMDAPVGKGQYGYSCVTRKLFGDIKSDQMVYFLLILLRKTRK